VTADSRLVCRRCGFTNVPGDQFCGSCGAFLEWEGESVGQADAPTQPVDLRDPDVPRVHPTGGAAAGASAFSTTAPGAGTAPYPAPPTGDFVPPPPDPTGSATQPYPVAPPDAGLIRCPACGIANAATRTFCQSCGTKLAEAPRVGEVSRDQILAAVSAPVGPRPMPPGPVHSVNGEPVVRGGAGKWIVIMAVIGVLVGIGAVAASNLLRGDGPSSDATTNPSAGVGGVPSGQAPGSGGAPASGEAPASGDAGAPATAAPEPAALALIDATASSVVGDLPRFSATRAIDGDPATCWQEGAKAEKGEWIKVTFAPSTVSALTITNGYNASAALYRGNKRLKDIAISIDGGAPTRVRLDDTGKPQRVNLTDVAGATSVQVTIVTTYPGKKTTVSGTPFDDAALGEIVVIGIPGA
jgi:hypothetical protein